MLETYSPSGSEEKLAGLLRDQFASHGFKTRIDKAGNVIGEIGNGHPRILLCGHMDTVPGEINVRQEGDLLYGRGSVDAKSSLAAMFVGSHLAKQQGATPFHVTLAAVVEEETTSAGAKAIIEEGGTYDCAIFGEPSGASNIVIGYKGSLRLKVTCSTSGGHSASPWLSKNSYDEAYIFWKALEGSFVQNDSSSKFTALTGCVTNASAGDASNNIPSRANLEIDLRIPPGMSPAELGHRITEFAQQYQSGHEGVRILIETADQTDAYVGDEESKVVAAFRWAIRKITSGPVLFVKKTGTSDMNLFAESYHIPMFAYGAGDSTLDHTENEHVSITEYLNSIEVYASALQRVASISQNSKSTLLHQAMQ
jgi:LysW-gamma-L-lysine carboxypeptidase